MISTWTGVAPLGYVCSLICRFKRWDYSFAQAEFFSRFHCKYYALLFAAHFRIDFFHISHNGL